MRPEARKLVWDAHEAVARIQEFTGARGHIAGFGGVAGTARRLARNVSPTRGGVTVAEQLLARNVSPTAGAGCRGGIPSLPGYEETRERKAGS